MSKTINAGRVTFVPKDNFSNNISYKKFDIVTYNGSSYFAKKDTIGHTPTEEEFWQLVAEKGQNGAPGAVKMQVVDTLPETGETDTIYLVKKDNPGEQNLYDEYIYTDTGWEHIGDTSVDLSNYYTKEESDTKLNEKQDKLPIYYASVYTPIKDLLPIFNSWLSDYKRTNMMPMFSMGYSDTPYTGNSMYLKSVEYDNTTKLWYFNFSSTIGELSAPITQEIYMLSYDSENEVFLRCQKAGHNGQYLTPMYDFSKGASFGKRALSTTNTEEYTPTSDYNPATKKYVDDNVKTYTAGDNITISEDNVISVSGIEFPIYRIQTIANYINSTGYTSIDDQSKLKITEEINKAYKNGLNSIGFIVSSGANNEQYLFVNNNNNIQNKPPTYWLYSIDSIHNRYNNMDSPYQLLTMQLSINLSWTGDTCSCTSASIWKVELPLLATNNSGKYTPTGDYNPATKKYVDDQVGNINTVLATLTTVSEVTK